MIDITHGIARHDVRAGRARAAQHAAVHAGRRAPGGRRPARSGPSAARSRCAPPTDDRLLVGPDNGLLSLAWPSASAAWSRPSTSRRSPCRLEPVSATFHGRDIFAPVAARLAAGRARSPTPASRSTRTSSTASSCRAPRGEDDALVAHALAVDRFGNVVLDVDARATSRAPGCALGAPVRAARSAAQRYTACVRATFADVRPGELLVYEDAYRTLALAVNRGDAAGAARPRAGRRAAAAAGVSGALGRPRLHLRAIDSTNERARELAAAGAPHGTLVTAGEQTAGRGRQGRALDARRPAAALLMSLVLRELRRGCCRSRRRSRWPRRSATTRAIKWPNDVLARRPQGRRDPRRGPPAGGLGGARDRPQRRGAADELPAELRDTAATLGARAGARSSRRWRALLERARALARGRRRPRSSTRGAPATRWRARAVRWAGGAGTAAGIDDDGRLLVELADGGARRARRRRGAPGALARARPCSSASLTASSISSVSSALGSLGVGDGPFVDARSRAPRRGPPPPDRRRPRPPRCGRHRRRRRSPPRVGRSTSLRRLGLLVRRRASAVARLAAFAASPRCAAAASRPCRPCRRRRCRGRAALGEVAQQLARQRARLARHARARAAQRLLGLGRVRQRGGEQRGRQAAVLLARRVHEPAGVARVRAAGRVDEQARAAAWSPASAAPRTPRAPRACTRPCARSRRWPGRGGRSRFSASAWSMHLDALAALVARPAADDVDRLVERLGVARGGDLLQRAQAQLRVAVALDGGEQEAALELAAAVEVQHRLGAAPAVRRHARAGQRRPHVLLAVVEVLDGDPPQLALEDLGAPLRIGASPAARGARRARRRPRPRRTGPTTIAPPR